MRTISVLYDGTECISKLLENETVCSEMEYLVLIYTASATKDEAVAIAVEVKELFPHAHVIGSSTSGVIYKGQQKTEGTLILFQEYDATQIYTDAFCWDGRTAEETAMLVAGSLKDRQARFMHIICGDHYDDIHQFVEVFGKLNGETMLAGGIAGDILSKGISGFVFTPEGVADHGIVIAALCGSRQFIYEGINIAHEPISPKYTFTAGDGSIWDTVNDEDAKGWVRKQFGIDQFMEFDDWQGIAANDTLVRFPIILEGHHGASRFLKYDAAQEKIAQYFSHIPAGTQFRIGYVNPSECVKEAFRICNEIMYRPVETLFCYSCLFRRLYLHNCAEWELSPYTDENLCGAFMMGEIGNINGTNEFLNGACVLLGMAEKNVHIRPNFNVFVGLNSIQDDTRDLLNFVLKKQSENVNQYNEELLKKLLERQAEGREQLFIDSRTGAGNYLKFREDSKKVAFNKLCMMRIENSGLLARHMGPEDGQRVSCDGIRQVKKHIEELNNTYRGLLCFYVFNEDSFFFAADERISENHFVAICRQMFDHFQIIRIEGVKELLITRFVLVVDDDDLIEKALNGFEAGKNMQTPFLICGKDKDDSFSTEEEFKIIGVLTRALEQDGIMPFFQGIYDNTNKRVNRYEALMRIIDWDGTVYMPLQFMDIAKKYHLYTHLSQIMIDKVFSRFAHTDEIISINFSAFDINSEEMQNMIFSRLDAIGDASNFIVEILEDEAFKDLNVLRDFVEKVRGYGVQIAIDDFGVGYSNLMEIASISPDYIKIDGDIIRNLPYSSVSRKLLDVITYMGRLFHADIVAEYVEDEVIQAMILEKQIRFSQGYYFSRPEPDTCQNI